VIRRKSIYLNDYKGLNKSKHPSLIEDSESPNLKNCENRDGTLQRTRGMETFSTHVLPGVCRKIDIFSKKDGYQYLAVITDNAALKLNEATMVFEPFGQWATITSGRNFSTTTMNDLFIITDGTNTTKKWVGGSSQWAALGGTPPTHYEVTTFADYCILMNKISGYPQFITWSDTGNPEVWATGNAGNVEIDETPDFIIGSNPILDRLYIYKERSIWELIHVGWPSIFEIAKIIDGIGLMSNNAIENLGTKHYFLGLDNVYTFDGRQEEIIGDSIKKDIFGYNAVVNQEKLINSQLLYVEELEELWLIVPDLDSDYGNKIYKYNLDTNQWWYREYSKKIFSVGVWYKKNTAIWDNMEMTWSEVQGIWRSAAFTEGFPITLFATEIQAPLWKIYNASELNMWIGICSGMIDSSPDFPRYVAVAQTGTNRVITSDNGTDWTVCAASTANAWNAVCWGNWLYVAVAVSGTGNRVMTSVTGLAGTWTTRTSAADYIWSDIAYGTPGGTPRYVAVSHDGGVTGRSMYSNNGTSGWTLTNLSMSIAWKSICYGTHSGAGIFVTVGESAVNNCGRSTTGTDSWSYSSMPAGHWYGVCWGNPSGINTFIAVGSGSGSYKVAKSIDGGATWTAVAVPQGYSLYDVAWNGTYFCAVGDDGIAKRSYYSLDGDTWVLISTPQNPEGTDYAWRRITEGGVNNADFAAVSQTTTGSTYKVMTATITSNTLLKQLSTETLTDDGTYPECFYETKDISVGEKLRLTGFELQCESSSNTSIHLYFSIDEGRTWFSLGEQNAPTTWNTLKWNLNVTSSRIRTKLVFGDGDIKCESRRFIFVKRTN